MQDRTFQIRQMECEVKGIINDHDRHYIMGKGKVNKVDFMIMNIYASLKMSSNYLNQQLWRKLDTSKMQLANRGKKKA